MIQWLKDLFSDSSSVSMTRFLSFICVVTASIISFYGTFKAQDVTALVATLLGAGLTAKVAQKSFELKNPAVSSNISTIKSKITAGPEASPEDAK